MTEVPIGTNGLLVDSHTYTELQYVYELLSRVHSEDSFQTCADVFLGL